MMSDSRGSVDSWIRSGAILIAGLAVGWGLSSRPSTALVAQQATPANVGQGQLTTQITGQPGQTQWLTLVNPATQSLAVYRFEPNNPRGVLKLEAVRHFRWDMMLSEFQNLPPEVSAVESMTRGANKR